MDERSLLRAAIGQRRDRICAGIGAGYPGLGYFQTLVSTWVP